MTAADWTYVQMCKQPVIELRFGLGHKQAYILYDFLAIDNGQPLSVWFDATILYHCVLAVSIFSMG